MKKLLVAHLAILTLPILAMGEGHALLHPKAIACIVLLLGWSVVEASLSFTETHPQGNRSAVVSGVALLAIAWLAITSSTREVDSDWVGAGIALSGILLRGLAITTLGRHFSSAIEPTSPSLMTMGIYRVVRHPSELGLFLISVGIAVLGGSRRAEYVIAIVLLPSMILRVIQEERALSARFGDRMPANEPSVRTVLGGDPLP